MFTRESGDPYQKCGFLTAKERRMRKNVYEVLGLAVLFGVLFAFGGTKMVSAEVNVNINLGPPPIQVTEPQEVVLIPNSRVYFVPGLEFDVFFYNDYWWSPRGNRWYRAKAYNGPWKTIIRLRVPAPVYRVPKDYRARYEKEKHIPYGQWKKQGKDNNQNNKKDNKNGRGNN